MAVGLRLDFTDLTLQDYDGIREALNFPADWPGGLRARASTEVDGRLRVMDMWESRQKFDQFVESRLQSRDGEGAGRPR